MAALWAVSPTDAWAVGDYGMILHWDGSAWSFSSAPALWELWSVWGSAANDVWTAGDYGMILHRK